MTNIQLSTTEMPPSDYEILGLVNGIQVKSMNIFMDIVANIANIFGTGSKDWTKVKDLFDKTREEAVEEMSANAENLGATDVIGVRIDVSELSRGKGQGMLVVAAYGTAIRKKGQTGGICIFHSKRKRLQKSTRKKRR